ncbi:50S ribosomal protein L21 [bacterium]|nr:50S ribosomal protein L21 [bacterium]MCB1220115.1 50S ribosomal protein L21 [bacterium]UNM07777.1 MAG: 50S ribosomal protein L21 [Planctomycetales bacterium]
MIAIVEIKGKQYRVEKGQTIRTLQVAGDAGGSVNADRVLATYEGDKISVGQPALDKASVTFEIVRHAKSPKIYVGTYQSKKRQYSKNGYRDKISYLRVTDIKG